MTIAPNSGKPIFQSWEQVQSVAEAAFKFLGLEKIFTARLNISLQSFAKGFSLSGLGVAKNKIVSLFGSKGGRG